MSKCSALSLISRPTFWFHTQTHTHTDSELALGPSSDPWAFVEGAFMNIYNLAPHCYIKTLGPMSDARGGSRGKVVTCLQNICNLT